jgi:predicted dehydrogenase
VLSAHSEALHSAPGTSTSPRQYGGAGARLAIVVVGAGIIGRKHIDYVLRSPHWSLAGIAEPCDGGRDCANRLGVSWRATAAELLDDVKPDAALIATPNDTHRELALACLERGIPVMIEKPIAASSDDATAIAAAAQRSGVPVLVGHHRRHNPIVQCARSLLGKGLIGEITNVAVLYAGYKPPEYFKADWRSRLGGGPVLINLIHEIDMIRYLCGEIESIQAFTSNAIRRFEVEDTAAVLLRMVCGALVTLTLSDTAATPWSWDLAAAEIDLFPPQPAPVHTHFFCGSHGALALPTLERWSYRGVRNWYRPITRDVIAVERSDPFVEQLHHFYRVVRGEEVPRITAADGASTLRATLAVLDAARSTERVVIA